MDTIFTKVEGESFTVNDTVGTSGSALTQARTSANKEPANNIPAGRDTNGDGLWDGFTGQGYLDMGGNAGDRASTSIYVPEAGTYTITFRYSHGGGTAPQTNRDMTLTIDGVTKTVSFPGTGAGAWDNWATAKVQFDLPAGTSTIAIANTIDNGPNIDSVIVSRDIPAPADFQPLVIQAESGVITLKNEADANSTIVRDPSNRESNASLPNGLRPGFTGTGYLDFGDDAGDRVTYTVNVAEAGAYDLSIRYASQPLSNGSPRSLALDVNGASLANTVFPTTGPSSGPAELQGFNVWGFVTQTVALKAGENTITLAIPAGATAGPNLDRLEITRAATGPIPADASADVDSNLALVALDPSLAPAEAAAAAFRLTGVDADVKSFEISFNGGTTRTAVTPVNEGDGSYLITLDLSARPVGNAELTVIVTDNAGNTAQKSAAVTIEDVPVNQAPTGVTLTAVATQVVENVDHSGGLKVAEITVADDGLGSNTLALTGADVAAFEIRDGGLYFVGTADFETKASYQVAVTVGDASLGDGVDATSESFTLAVTDLDETPENRAPVVVGEGLVDAQAAEDSAFSLDLRTKFSDADGDTLTFTATGLPAWLKLENGVLTGTPADSDVAGPVSITVTAKDAAGLEVSDSFNLTVTNTNDAPTLAQAPADQTGKVGQAFSLALPASMFADADLDSGDALTWSVGALPAGVTFDPATRTFSGTPTAAGTHQVTVTATDTANATASDTFALVIAPADPAPFQPIVIQAESGTIALAAAPDSSSTMVRDPAHPESNQSLPNGLRPGFTGTGYLDFGNDAGDRVTYAVDISEAGQYDLNIRYASNGARPLVLAVNSGATQTLPFAATGTTVQGPTEGFNNWAFQTVTISLAAGQNTISLAIPPGATLGPNLDRIEITRAGTGPIPVDTSADEDEKPLFLDGPDGELSGAAAASINFNIAGVDQDIVKIELSFDGGTTRTDITSLPDADGDFVFNGSSLPAGLSTVTVIVTDEAGNEARTSSQITIADDTATPVEPFTIQAEDATKVTVQDAGVPTNGNFTRVVDAANPDATGNHRAGATGGAYMDFGTNPGDAITFNVTAPVAGTYLVTFRYANGGTADRPLDLSLNGGTATSVAFVPGPVVGSGPTATGWESWVEKTVELNLQAGANAIKLAIPANAANGPNIDQATFRLKDGTGGPTDPEPFTLTIEAETFTPNDTTGTGNQITQARTPLNQEPAGNIPTGRDANNDGLWDGFTGQGYLDMGGQVGDAATFKVNAPAAGSYTFSFRYSNGGSPQGDRPMTVTVGGETKTVSFPGTGTGAWDSWQTATIKIDLQAGENTVSIANTIANGPNIDNVTVTRDIGDPVDPRGRETFVPVVKINFEPAPGQTTQGLPAGYTTPAGYLADTGAAFGERGNGLRYGWVTEASVADGTANGTIAAAQPANAHWYKNTVATASSLQKTYAHFEYPGAGAAGARAWEMALENGTYQVTMSIGDTAGAFDSKYKINLEGQSAGPTWTPAGTSQNGDGFRSTLVTRIVQVTDGRLTIDSIGGENTEIQYLEIERVPDLTPGDNRTADLDYSLFAAPVAAYLNDQVSIAIGESGSLPTGINPLSSLIVGVNVQAPNHRGPNVTHVDNVKLIETLTGQEVAINVQVSGGADSLTIKPLQPLKENTSYTLKVQDVLDLGSITDGTAPLRQMQDLTTTFVTGEAPDEVAREVAFTTQTLLDGFADGAGGFTAIEFGPDGKLYVATITGEIYRWSVNANGTINEASKESLIHDYFKQADGDRRGIVGFTFDPEDPNTIWISNNYAIPRENKAFDTPEFSGRISKITLGTGGSFQGATIQTYIDGLPRSGGDHLTNSLEFRVNPNAGQTGEPNYLLYVSQGSNSAAGAPDNAWGNRPERLLNAAVLEIDPRRAAPNGGFDVRTEPVTTPTTSNPAASFNADGTYPGFYNPFADNAVLKVYATGIRNAYDLVWHSNGHLYMPTNGTASGGKTFDDPTQSGSQVIVNSPKQYDYFFTVEEGKYYGHPNQLRDQYVLNGGNPTAGVDPNEVTDRKDGNPNTDGYDVGVRPDPNYDLDGVYNLGYNQSPNGATEYKGNAFGSNLKGAILFAQFSAGDNVRAIQVDAQGKIIGDEVLRRPDGSIIDDYIDPLDIIENPATGQLYLMTLNRGTGASQLILLTPAPGGVSQDITADEGGNLALVVVDASNPANTVFQVNGLDDDITALRVTFNNGAPQTVVLDGQKRFTADLASLSGSVTARLEVTDDAQNRATATTTLTPGQGPAELVSLVTIQAEDITPADGTSVSIATGASATIQIRSAANPEASGTTGLVNGLRPGAYGLDGNTNNTDGVPGGYADFGSTPNDFVTFNFEVPAAQAGAGTIKVRYGNGGTADRPLVVLVNGASVGTFGFSPPSGVTGDAAWATWQTLDIPANLVAGLNTVTFRATTNTGPNIDQIEVLAPKATQPNPTYSFYEAENAVLSGAVVATDPRNQEGTGYVDFTTGGDQSITWTVNSAQAGEFEIAFRYALAATKADRPMMLTVNGVNVGPVNFEGFSNAAETEWQFQSAAVNLVAGANTIKVTAPNAVGPNIDQLRVTNAPAAGPFDPDYVAVTGETRIELEQNANNSTRIINGNAVEFYFTVAANGLYALDLAANAGAPNGQGLTLYLNGGVVDDLAFPGTGAAGERTAFLQLEAGKEYQLRVVSDAPGASAIDYLDVRPLPVNANADVVVQSLDPAFHDNRLHFNYLEDPDSVAPDDADRDFKDSGTVRLTNTGTAPLSVLDAEISGPFKLANPSIFTGLTLAAGQSINVEVLFDRAAYTPPTSNVDVTSTVFEGSIRLITNDAENPVSTIDLAGFWQSRDEGGQEPNVNEVWKIFGFGNVIEGLTTRGGGENSTLSTNDVFAKTDETEVLSPYWKIADGATEAKITHIAAFHGTGGATIHLHNPGNKGANIQLWNHEGTDNQRLLPNMGNDTTFATRTFTRNDVPDGWVGNDMFGISVAGLSTDPRLNPRGDVLVPGAQQGHTVKMFQALDKDGNVLPNVYLGIMDYTGINYDYNDNMFVIEGVAPVGFGQSAVVRGLDDAAADERLVFTNIDNPVNASQAFRNEATFTITNDGFAALSIESITTGNSAFQIVGTVPTSIAAGATANVTVRFVGAHQGTGAGAELYNSTLTIRSNDVTQPVKVIQLAGLAQEFSENNSEPDVAQIVEAFGYGTDVAQGELAGGGVVEAIGDEVLMPYLQRLDTTKAVDVIQIAAFLNQGNVARLGFHNLQSSQVTPLFANDDQQGQTVLPDQLVAGAGAGANVARATINQNGPFGLYISVDGRPTYASWTDPEANKIDPNFGQLVGDNQGHLIRFFKALDKNGDVIEGTYIGIQDYPGAGNYDYNDHMFVIKNVKAYDPAGVEDANRNGVIDALQTDTDNDGIVNFFDTSTNTGNQTPFGGTAPSFVNGRLTVDASNFDQGGQGVAYNDNTGKDGGNTSFRPGEAVEFVGAENDIGYVRPGEWVEYTINVPQAGTYALSLTAKTPLANATVAISLGGGTPLATVTLPDGGADFGSAPFQASAPVNLTLPAGQQTIRLAFNGTPQGSSPYLLDLRSFTVDYVPPANQQTPFSGSAIQVGANAVTINAALFDNGGQGVAFNDTTPTTDEGGTAGRNTGVDVLGNNAGIGWIANGEWVEYTINVAQAGKYDLRFNAATPDPNRTITASFEQGGTFYATANAANVVDTNNYTSFTPTQAVQVDLKAGVQTVRLSFNGGAFDLQSFTIGRAAASAPIPSPEPGAGAARMGLVESLSSEEATAAIYIGYLDRVPDEKGYQYWLADYMKATQAGVPAGDALNRIANAFTPQMETFKLYPFLQEAVDEGGSFQLAQLASSPALKAALTGFVQDVYSHLFGRAPAADDTGLQYWVEEIGAGRIELGHLILAIANGAINPDGSPNVDGQTLLNKIAVAEYFFAEKAGGVSAGDETYLIQARQVLDRVSEDPSTVEAAKLMVDTYVAGGQVFVFEPGQGRATVTAFDDGLDRIDVSGLAGVDTVSDLTLTDTAAGVEIHHGTDVLVLAEIPGTQIDERDFIL